MAKFFSLEALPAREGDCLLLHYGDTDEPRVAVIDAGPKEIYRTSLKPRLAQIRGKRGLAPGDTLPINWLAVSHIDGDHITGVIDLVEELRQAVLDGKVPPYRIGRFWHNSFTDLLGELRIEPASMASLAAATNGLVLDSEIGDDERHLLADVPQGFILQAMADGMDLKVNAPVNELVTCVPATRNLNLGGGLAVTVAGPLKPEIDDLRAKYVAWLTTTSNNRKKALKETLKEILAAYGDRSPTNLSSVVMLVKRDGKSMLLTGDARGDKVIAGLKSAGIMSGETLRIDILKGMHHGSDQNVKREFFEQVIADHYVFSGNGLHGNPDAATFRWLFEARAAVLPGVPFSIYLTYTLDKIDKVHEADRASDGKEWIPEKHSLVKLFAKAEADGVPFRLKAPGSRIDLLDAPMV